jgi:type IV secretion system protein VirB10
VGAEQLTDLYGLITQGTLISGIMETAISSNLPGLTRAIVTDDVYSFDKQNLLIPTGSMLVGHYRSAVQQGQSRVFIIWNRLIRPDGVSIRLASYSTDSLGRTGAAGRVDTHFWERFGSSVMLSLIDAGAQIATQSANDSNTNIALNTSDGLSRASEIALENTINIPPTIHVDQGERIKVLVGQDLDFSTVRKTAWHE